jgi:hypothetical protein
MSLIGKDKLEMIVLLLHAEHIFDIEEKVINPTYMRSRTYI